MSIDAEKWMLAAYHAQRFSQAVQDSPWLRDKGVSFGDFTWAMDALSLHNLYMVLNDFRPDYVLEFGLGQSSKIVHQYADYYGGTRALTYEDDPKWIEYMTRHCEGIPLNCKHDPMVKVSFEGTDTYAYKSCLEQDAFKHLQEFGKVFIVVDGPDCRFVDVARTQVLALAPHLKRDFCILMHDSEFKGVKKTIELLLGCFNREGRAVDIKEFYCAKDHVLICNREQEYLLRV